MPVAFNPADPEQRAFLASIAKGETGGKADAALIGNGGKNLAGYATDQYGFPQWEGLGNSHAAGFFQFQPGTWAEVASTYGLNFQNPQDQATGAWYLAQEVYAKKTGMELDDQLDKGNFGSIQQALGQTWTSANGNAAIPQGLAREIAAELQGGSSAPWEGAAGSSVGPSGQGGLVNQAEDFFVRFGLITVGVLVVLVALWQLLSNQGIVPSPQQAAKAVSLAI